MCDEKSISRKKIEKFVNMFEGTFTQNLLFAQNIFFDQIYFQFIDIFYVLGKLFLRMCETNFFGLLWKVLSKITLKTTPSSKIFVRVVQWIFFKNSANCFRYNSGFVIGCYTALKSVRGMLEIVAKFIWTLDIHSSWILFSYYLSNIIFWHDTNHVQQFFGFHDTPENPALFSKSVTDFNLCEIISMIYCRNVLMSVFFWSAWFLNFKILAWIAKMSFTAVRIWIAKMSFHSSPDLDCENVFQVKLDCGISSDWVTKKFSFGMKYCRNLQLTHRRTN